MQRCGELLFGVQEMQLPNDVDISSICALTMEPLSSLPKVGVFVWCNQPRGRGELSWKYLCQDDEHQISSKLHVFDFEQAKGYVQAQKEYLKCPLCFKGAIKSKKIVQEEAEFTENLISRRTDCLNESEPDLEMALYWEQHIVRQILLNNEVEHEEIMKTILKEWSVETFHLNFGPLMEIILKSDLLFFFRMLLDVKGIAFHTEKVLQVMEEACRFQSVDVITEILQNKQLSAPVSRICLRHLIGQKNEYLLEILLEHYKRHCLHLEKGHEEPISRRDWHGLGVFAFTMEMPSFILMVQRMDIYPMVTRLYLDTLISNDQLQAFGIHNDMEEIVHSEEDWNDNSDEDEEDWE